MPVSEAVNTRGIRFYYEDTGPPSNATAYTTLLIVHGTSYHSAIFHKLFPYAASLNLRLVLLNRRDYPGTTPTSQEETARIRSPDVDIQREALRDLGLELARFVIWYTKVSGIPPISQEDGEKEGGLAVIAWSSGNATCCSMVANLEFLSDKEQGTMRAYLRTYIIYDSPCYVFGIPPSPSIYDPWLDTSLSTSEMKTERFNTWVTSYYHHPEPSSGEFSGLAEDGIANPSPEKTPTMHRLDVEKLTAPEARTRGEGWVQYIDVAVYRENIRKLFSLGHLRRFPRLRIRVVYCRETIPEMVWGAYRLLYDAEEEGWAREVGLCIMEGNHFAHWDLPQETLQSWARI
ncbi:hypothetical protein OE88DRAFT_1655507, partial [Heliocybe sulcata]